MGYEKIKKDLGKMARFLVEMAIMELTALAFLMVISVTWADSVKF